MILNITFKEFIIKIIILEKNFFDSCYFLNLILVFSTALNFRKHVILFLNLIFNDDNFLPLQI